MGDGSLWPSLDVLISNLCLESSCDHKMFLISLLVRFFYAILKGLFVVANFFLKSFVSHSLCLGLVVFTGFASV